MLLAILVASLYRQLKSSSIRGVHPNIAFNVFMPLHIYNYNALLY